MEGRAERQIRQPDFNLFGHGSRDLYVTAVDKLLEGAPGITEAFDAVVAEDPDFALGRAGLADTHPVQGL